MLEVAIDKLVEAIDIEPNDPIIHFALAELLYFDGQYLRASSEYETVLETENIKSIMLIYSHV